MTTPRAQWKAALVEKAMQFPQLENILKHNRSSDFEKWQRILLFAAFKKYPSLTDERWAELTAEVELTKDQVISWFYSRKSDDAKKKMEEIVSTVNFREFQLEGPPTTEKEKKEVAAKHANIKKRVQFVFNPSQIEILNEFFKKNARPMKKDMEELRAKLGDVEHKQIKQWFSNKRKRCKEYQEHYHQGESVDKKPTQRHSCSAFPVGVRNILLEEFEKCSNVNLKNMKRIMKDTGMSKTQRQPALPPRNRLREQKQIQYTFELVEDDAGNVAINIPSNLFEPGTEFTIQRKASQSTASHKNAKRSKVTVTSEDVDNDDEQADRTGNRSAMKKSIGVSKRKNEKTEKPEKSLPSTTRQHNRKRARVPSETEETDDDEEDEPAPVFRKWNEIFKKLNEKSTQVASQNVHPSRSKANVSTEIPDELDTSDVVSSNSSFRTIRRSRRNLRAFFRRTIKRVSELKCRKKQCCEVSRGTRNLCQYCRFQKFLVAGMSLEKAQQNYMQLKDQYYPP
ncbi:hypothetical protein CAEBREN_21369 [Caenorhabditis brenneri]|uniref:Homeobox domain-containing protein n=1 Tax=Caenorhabditis brenneri TaxID=135651 RepID=G0NNT0_CAEBE|nr:hypothetical protein CAEBREN_21369 [Caenorhabditis brenneri]